MPKQPNYNFEKRRKEQARQAKKEAKLWEKAQRKQEAERVAAQSTPNDPPVAK